MKSKFKIKILILITIILLGYYFFYPLKSDDRPNVILISFDTLRADHLGVYGYEKDTTPNLDAFSKNSVVYENAITQAPWTLPAHTSIFTGLYPQNHGVRLADEKLPDEIPTLMDYLKNQGYDTIGFFNSDYFHKKYNIHGFKKTKLKRFWEQDNFDEIISWLGKRKRRPYFLFWHDFTAHCPYEPLEKFDVFTNPAYSGILDLSPRKNIESCDDLETGKFNCRFKCRDYYEDKIDSIKQEDIEYVKSKYDGEIRQLDDKFGKFIKKLKEKKQYNNTIIIFLSDHGESFLDREHKKKIGHSILYQEVLHVPLIIKYPSVNKAIRITDNVETIDVMPTILKLLNITLTKPIDGTPLPARNLNLKQSTFSELTVRENTGSRTHYSLIQGKNKIIKYQYEKTRYETYNLQTDPKEQKDKQGNNKTLDEKLKSEINHLIKTPRKAEKIPIDEETSQILKNLGYLI